MQLKRNWTQRYHWYPKPLAIRQQKTRLVHKHQPGTPPLLPLSGGSMGSLFVSHSVSRSRRPATAEIGSEKQIAPAFVPGPACS